MAKVQDWEDVLSSACRLQEYLPQAVVVGGTAAAIYANHRKSYDHDHVITDLKLHFDEILAQLESVAGWKTARVKRPVLILGSLDNVETGIRQLIREKPLETEDFYLDDRHRITLPTPDEVLRIKSMLMVRRNAMRDYLDTCAIADWIAEGNGNPAGILNNIEDFYENGEDLKQQLIAQLSNPLPYDFSEKELKNYKGLKEPYSDWKYIRRQLMSLGVRLQDLDSKKDASVEL